MGEVVEGSAFVKETGEVVEGSEFVEGTRKAEGEFSVESAEEGKMEGVEQVEEGVESEEHSPFRLPEEKNVLPILSKEGEEQVGALDDPTSLVLAQGGVESEKFLEAGVESEVEETYLKEGEESEDPDSGEEQMKEGAESGGNALEELKEEVRSEIKDPPLILPEEEEEPMMEEAEPEEKDLPPIVPEEEVAKIIQYLQSLRTCLVQADHTIAQPPVKAFPTRAHCFPESKEEVFSSLVRAMQSRRLLNSVFVLLEAPSVAMVPGILTAIAELLLHFLSTQEGIISCDLSVQIM